MSFHISPLSSPPDSFNSYPSAQNLGTKDEQKEEFFSLAKPKSLSKIDYFFQACKFIYPHTKLHHYVNETCQHIAFPIGVGATHKIDWVNRAKLSELGAEDIRFKTQDGLTLEGMYFQNPNPVEGAQTILICSGSHASHEKYTVAMVDALQKLGHHVMVFNYRGFGKSEGITSEEGLYLDVEAAYQYLKVERNKSDAEIAVLGYSLGSAVATDLAANHAEIKLILDRYFSSMKDVARDKGGKMAKKIFCIGGARFDTKSKIKKVKGKIFLASSIHHKVIKPYHRAHLLNALLGYPDATFVDVSSPHFHSSYSALWFHPENDSNRPARGRLQQFLLKSL